MCSNHMMRPQTGLSESVSRPSSANLYSTDPCHAFSKPSAGGKYDDRLYRYIGIPLHFLSFYAAILCYISMSVSLLSALCLKGLNICIDACQRSSTYMIFLR